MLHLWGLLGQIKSMYAVDLHVFSLIIYSAIIVNKIIQNQYSFLEKTIRPRISPRPYLCVYNLVVPSSEHLAYRTPFALDDSSSQRTTLLYNEELCRSSARKTNAAFRAIDSLTHLCMGISNKEFRRNNLS